MDQARLAEGLELEAGLGVDDGAVLHELELLLHDVRLDGLPLLARAHFDAGAPALEGLKGARGQPPEGCLMFE
eukprot:13662403-Alexandrium_andersonii.AAC.1